MTKRIYSFGCSVTSYFWPTWADMLAYENGQYQNWAIPGTGNRAIFERLVEVVNREMVSADDIVLIQWTEPHRHDLHRTNAGPADHSNWFMGGNIFNNCVPQEWIESNWDEYSYVMHTANWMRAADMILKHIGCRYWFTCLGDPAGWGHLELTQDCPPLALGILDWRNSRYPNRSYRSFQQPSGEIMEDLHLTPIEHWHYAQQHAPEWLPLKVKEETSQEWERFYLEADTYMTLTTQAPWPTVNKPKGR